MMPRLPLARTAGLLPGFGTFSVLPMLIGIIVFLTALALAGALSLTSAAQGIARELSRTLTVQIVHGDPATREREARAAAEALRSIPGVSSVKPLNRAEIAALLEPWIGAGINEPDLPLPALIDVTIEGPRAGRAVQVRGVLKKFAPHARVDAQATWLEPLSGLLSTLRLLGISIVLLVALALVGTVVLATRAALNTHRETIEVMHLMGATDGQISRLFERRAAVDGLVGGLLALGLAIIVLFGVKARAAAIGSGLLQAAAIPVSAWVALALLPVLAAGLAALTARVTVFQSLNETL